MESYLLVFHILLKQEAAWGRASQGNNEDYGVSLEFMYKVEFFLTLVTKILSALS